VTAPHASDVLGTFTDPSKQKRYHRATGWVPIAQRTPRLIERLTNSVQNELGIQLEGEDVIRTS